MLSSRAVVHSGDREPADKSTVIAGYAMAIGRALEYRGVDSTAIFRAVGLPERVSNDPMDRMTSTTTAALYAASVAATQDPYFGLTVAQFMQASNLHALGHGLLASATLLDMCLRFARNFALASQSAVARVERSETEVALRFRHVVPVCGESEDACLAFVVKLMRMLDPTAVGPVGVHFQHVCPAPGSGPYTDFFGAVPEFDQRETALVWPVAEMLRPLSGDCLELAQCNDILAVEYIARIDLIDVIARVRAAVIELIPTGNCSRLRVAQALHMSAATLQAKLVQRGTSFNQVFNAARKEMALGYLSQRALSVAEVAYRLGFADTSNFARAFKRWTGGSPSEHRLASWAPVTAYRAPADS